MKNSKLLLLSGLLLFGGWLHAQTTYVQVGLTQAPLLEVDLGMDVSTPLGIPVQLNAAVSGGSVQYNFAWLPTTGLSDPTIANPLCTPTSITPVTYTCEVTDANGCRVTDDITVSVNNISIGEQDLLSSILIYPNPANDVLVLERPSESMVMTVRINDLSGRAIITQAWENGLKKTLMVSELPSGIYLISIGGNESSVQHRITIQR